MTNHSVKKATTHSADVQRLLKVFGLEGRQVTSLTFNAKATNLITLTVECEISEDELKALVDEFEASPPKQQDFLKLRHRLSDWQPANPPTTESKT